MSGWLGNSWVPGALKSLGSPTFYLVIAFIFSCVLILHLMLASKLNCNRRIPFLKKVFIIKKYVLKYENKARLVYNNVYR